MAKIKYELSDGIAVITMDNPPLNALGHALRAAIVDALGRANADTAVSAIVLAGSARAFSGGADIGEFGTPNAAREPGLSAVLKAVESSAKPVIAAIGGVCMGGGLELALACHARVARPDASLALPEVLLGLLPGAGGTQRLPRAIGLQAALRMIVSGKPAPAAQFAGSALIDALAADDLLATALAFARTPGQPVLLRERPVERDGAQALLQAARDAAGSPAAGECVEALAAALHMPFDEGLAAERAAFVRLMATPQSRALRHAFSAERACARIADVPADTALRAISSVAVIGAGTMGGGIAMNFLNAGLRVTLLEMQQEALERGVATIRKNYDNSVGKGKLAPAQLAERMALLATTTDYHDIANADLVIEAVYEELGVKRQVFERLDQVMKAGAILASNTSTLDMNLIAGFTTRPQDVVGLHFFSPANVMRLLEVVRAEHTANDVLATVMQLAKKIGKVAVVSGVCDGFIGNRMLKPYRDQALALVEEGASPRQVDAALESWGMAMGPFRMGDLAGLDIGWAIRKRMYAEDPGAKRSVIADQLCELGRFGQKTGKGWYAYPPGQREPLEDPLVDELIAAYRTQAGIRERSVSDQEIVERCIYALANEGARILDEGIAARASDIDVVYLAGYGFPRDRGGPMLVADMAGLPNVLASIRSFGDAFGDPAPLLVALADAGKSFTASAEQPS